MHPSPPLSLLPHFCLTSLSPHPILLQTALGYYDVCSALQIDPLHKDASEIKKKLQKDALACKNQVRMLMSHTLKPCYTRSLPSLRPQAVHHSLVGRKMEALKKITAAIETDPAVPEYHTFR